MQCSVPGEHVKTFGKAVQCLARIGDDVYFEASRDALSLKTVNQSRSAYCCFVFRREYFQTYKTPGLVLNSEAAAATNNAADNDSTLLCKASSRSCLNVFRGLPHVAKSAERLRISFDRDTARLVFRVQCQHGIVKTHHLNVEDCESLRAV